MYGKRETALVASALAALVAAGLASVASGASSANRQPARASEYPLSVVVTKTSPRRPKAGEPFIAMIGIVNQETGDVVQSGDVACPARIGHRDVRMLHKEFADGEGIAFCMWAIPARSGRKHMVAKVEVYSDEGTVRSQFLRVVRR